MGETAGTANELYPLQVREASWYEKRSGQESGNVRSDKAGHTSLRALHPHGHDDDGGFQPPRRHRRPEGSTILIQFDSLPCR